MRNKKNSKKNIFIILFLIITYSISFSLSLKKKKTVIPETPIYINKVKIIDKIICGVSIGDSLFYFIDRNGKILQKFDIKGKGPGELDYITGFGLFNNNLIISGGRRINLYSLTGKSIENIKKDDIIENLLSSNKRWYYVTCGKIFKKKKKIFEIEFRLYNDEDRLIMTLPDRTKQRAFHPKKGRRLAIPWFPSPFCDRLVFMITQTNNIAVFMTRQDYFYLVEDDKIKKISFKFNLKAKALSDQDKKDFFNKIIPKPSKLTKNSVVFPKTKKLFLGVINWDDNWALIQEDNFILVDEKGSFLNKIPIPDEIGYLEDWQVPEDIFIKNGDELFFLKESEEIVIFEIK